MQGYNIKIRFLIVCTFFSNEEEKENIEACIENEDLIIDECIEESINSEEIRAIIFCEGEFSTHIFPSIFIDMKAKEMKNALMRYCSDIIINQIEI